METGPQPAYSASGRTRSHRTGAIAAAAAAGLLLVGAAGFAFAASPSASSSGADPSASAAPSGPAATGAPARPGAGMPGQGMPGRGLPGAGGLLRGMLGMPGGPGRPFAAIHISAIDGANLALATEDGWTRTIAIGSGTTITKAGRTITAGDLKVGDQIRFAETRAADGTYTIDRIDVVLPRLVGQVTARSGDTVTVKRLDGSTATVHLGSSTTYRTHPNQAASAADVTVNAWVVVEGTARSDGSLDALQVLVGRPTTVEGGRGFGWGHGGPNGPGWPKGPNGQGGSTPAPSASSQPG